MAQAIRPGVLNAEDRLRKHEVWNPRRARLAQIVALAGAGDIAALQAFEINPVSSSPKAMARCRDICVIAITARAQVAA